MAESVAALLRGDTAPRRSRPVAVAAPRPQRSTGWDLLLVCVAVYRASGVGRIHDLFPVLLPLKPALLSTVLAIGLFVLQQRRERRLILVLRRLALRLAALAGLLVLVVPLIRSGSRGGFLAFLAIVAFILVGFTTVPARARITGLVVILTVLGATASDKYWTQMQTIIRPHSDYNLTDDTGRMKIWKRGIAYMLDRPMLGVGMGNFPTAEGTLSPLARAGERGRGVRWGAAHNTFVQIGAELGIPGLLFFIALIGSVFAALRRVTPHGARGDS